MTAPVTDCQCKRFPAGCSAQMTQEDLLCDTCRYGCTAAIGVDVGADGEDMTLVRAVHLHTSAFTGVVVDR